MDDMIRYKGYRDGSDWPPAVLQDSIQLLAERTMCANNSVYNHLRHRRDASIIERAADGWIISNGSAEPVRKNGTNLLNVLEGMICYSTRREFWPTIYPTREAAEAEQVRREAECNHSWTMISHEEKHCDRCGAYEFIADI